MGLFLFCFGCVFVFVFAGMAAIVWPAARGFGIIVDVPDGACGHVDQS